MSTIPDISINSGRLSLTDVLKSAGCSEFELRIATNLDRENAVLQDAYWQACLRGKLHLYEKITKLPRPEMQYFNKGVSGDKGDSVILTETCGQLGNRCEIDERFLRDLNAHQKSRLRENRTKPYIEGMGQALESGIFYGNGTDKIRINDTDIIMKGLDRLDSTLCSNVYSCGGKNTEQSLTSFYIIQWGVGNVSMLYPELQESKPIRHIDKGLEKVVDKDNKPYYAYVDIFESNFGVCIENERSVARVCNIDLNAKKEGDPGYLDIFKLRSALYKMKANGNNAIIYCNSDLRILLEQLAVKNGITLLPISDVYNSYVTTFATRPIKISDSIIIGEDEVTNKPITELKSVDVSNILPSSSKGSK